MDAQFAAEQAEKNTRGSADVIEHAMVINRWRGPKARDAFLKLSREEQQDRIDRYHEGRNAVLELTPMQREARIAELVAELPKEQRRYCEAQIAIHRARLGRTEKP
jgi:hypothetical protein